MGGIQSLSCKRWRTRNVKILFLGLHASGKTTILYRLKLDKVINTFPTIHGDVVETIDYGGVNYTAWDVGLGSMSRIMLRHYYPGTEAVIFVLDSNNRERYNEALAFLQETVSDEGLKDVPVLILANKHDLGGVISLEQIRSDLMMLDVVTNRKFEVFAVSALQGEGFREGLDWLTAVLTNTEPRMKLSENRQQNDNETNTKDTPKCSYYNQLYSKLVASLKQ